MAVPPEPPAPIVRRRDYWPSQSERTDAKKLACCACACPDTTRYFESATALTRELRSRLAGCCCGAADCSGAPIAANIYGQREVVLGATPAEDSAPCALPPAACNTQLTFNVTIIGNGAVDICGYDLIFTSSGMQVYAGPVFIAFPSPVAARADSGWAFSVWGGVLSGTDNPTEYAFLPVECQNTTYNITATFEAT